MAEHHTPTPWDAFEQCLYAGGRVLPIASGQQDWATNRGGPSHEDAKANAAFIVRACNAHDAMLAALKRIDAWWLDSFPKGPDAEDVSYGIGRLSDDTLRIWKQIQAAIKLAEQAQ